MSSHESKSKWEPREMQTPSDQWQSRARKYLEGAVNHLWAAEGNRWLGWLKEIRGLNEATIRIHRIGLQPIDRWEEREIWGLERVVKDNGRLKKLWLPEGLVIPFFLEDRISLISFRRKKSAGEPRYLNLDGSHSRPIVLHPERDILTVVESALDGFLLVQEAGDLAGVVILGSAQGQPDKELAAFLRRRKLILLALDADAAGAQGQRSWLEQFPSSRRWPPIRGKDPGEMLQEGIDLRLWIEVGISRFLDEVAGPEEEEHDLSHFDGGQGSEVLRPLSSSWPVKEEAPLENESQTANIRLSYEREKEPEAITYPAWRPQASACILICFECDHFRPAVNSPNPPQAWGLCRHRNKGRYGVAMACEDMIYSGGIGSGDPEGENINDT
jgi:hypothetical protein